MPDPTETWTAADGTAVAIRPIAAADFELELAFLQGLSARTGYQRLLSPRRLSRREVERLVRIDGECEIALIAITGQEGRERQIGVARLVREKCGEIAEIALVVADEWQRRGLGRRLLHDLIAAARRRGVRRLVGTTLTDNFAMIALAHALGFETALERGFAVLTNVSMSL
jgi:acetyltransferase